MTRGRQAKLTPQQTESAEMIGLVPEEERHGLDRRRIGTRNRGSEIGGDAVPRLAQPRERDGISQIRD